MDTGYSLAKLVQAYFDCRQHKRTTASALLFEQALEHNLMQLHEELQDGSYRFAVGARPLKAVLYEEPAAPAQQLAETIQQQVVTGSNMRGSAEYRNHLAGVLVKRAVRQLEG